MLITWKQADHEMVKNGEHVLLRLMEHGHEAYWVGGCVRDELMGRPVHDMDITTSALPDEVMAIFERTVPTGIAHGTVTVLSGSFAYEVTTYRVEGAYENHRRPTEVAFVRDLSQDLLRRDFTMNAIARARNGAYVDPYGGAKDIQAGMIRCVGNAAARFQEDALRMVRCIRFASVFGFKVAYRTWKGLLNERNGIQYIATERIRVEIEKMMAGPHPLRGLALLSRSGLLLKAKMSIPCLNQADPQLLSNLEEIPADDLPLRFALLLYACQISPEQANSLLRSWTFSNEMCGQITAILNVDRDIHTWPSDQEDIRLTWITLVLKYGRTAVSRWLQLRKVLSVPKEEKNDVETLLKYGEEWISKMSVFRLNELDISGSDLLSLRANAKGGPWVRELLDHLMRQTAAGYIRNEKAELIEEARRLIGTDGEQ